MTRLAAVPFVVLTIICWGMYGPVLHKGQVAMESSRMRALLCVGMAYFVIGVVVPIIVLNTGGEKGHFNFTGVLWSSAAGAAGALGALGIILAFQSGGSPHWVMPLVFGLAPVVNAFIAMLFSGTYDQVKNAPFFLAGLVIVSMGAFMVLFFAPTAPHHAPPAAESQEL
jgi:hypothetical protein